MKSRMNLCGLILGILLTACGCGQQIVFNVPDMMCAEGCGAKVNEILSGQPGAKEVLVDFEAKKATVAIDPSVKFDADAALAALVDHGFKNSSIKSDAATKDTASASANDEASAQ